MRKARIGILTFSDGRQFVHQQLEPLNQRLLGRVVVALQETGEVEVIPGQQIIWTSQLARQEAQRMRAQDVDATIFNYSIWAFPHLSAIAAENGQPPYLLLSNLNPTYPGLVGMMAAAGSLDQLGIPNWRLWGDISSDKKLLDQVLCFCRAARAVHDLRGQTYGLIGGRSLGMYTAVSDTRQWQEVFGVDVEHVDQLEIVRLAEQVPNTQAEKALKWLEQNVGEIHYDGKKLTPQKLKYQIKCYEATKRIIREKALDFVGIKCQPELSDNYVTQCLSAAFLNDKYDWNGSHEPIVCACEVDMDGALTMQILKLLSDDPVLFMDFRHYDEEEQVFVFCNCGSQATYYAGRSDDPKENLKNVHLYPQTIYYPAGGATVQYVARAGEVTLARLARSNGQYWMAIMPGEFVEYPRSKCNQTQTEWPHCFTKLYVSPEKLISEYGSNHAHGVYGNWTEELVAVCKMLGIKSVVYR
ncbi:MAG: L-fucose/L-arabinose isomerase family protein [Candidatus Latescibacteria bacterium]|nr:L-fucose/L-arabinose isomerase family protein [Candidatus Latescibacterota bacterium]